ncbi:MAG: hypothetical protein WBK77_10080 [Alphaproteobacteria bacterium]
METARDFAEIINPKNPKNPSDKKPASAFGSTNGHRTRPKTSISGKKKNCTREKPESIAKIKAVPAPTAPQKTGESFASIVKNKDNGKTLKKQK